MMIGLFQEQEHELQLQENIKRIQQNRALEELMTSHHKKDASCKIPFGRETERSELQRIVQQRTDKKCRNNIKLCEESISKELGEQKLNFQREEKIRQLLWETAPELRELRKKMLMANVIRDQALQIAEKEAVKELKREEEEALTKLAEQEKKELEEERRKKEEADFLTKLQYHKDLDELQQFKIAKKDTDEEQLQREKAAIDEIKRKIEEEDKEEHKRRIEAKKELRRQALELQQVRHEMILKERLKDKAQELKADEYRKMQELRLKEQEEKKQFYLQQRLQLQEELLSFLEMMYAEKMREESLWTELAVEEKEAMEKEKMLAAESRKLHLRDELQQLYDIQMYVKKQKEELEKKEEELFRESLMNQLYEEEKLELMSQQKRRLKQTEHRRTVQALIEQNHRKKEMEKAREMADQKLQEELESERLRMVDREREKFLKEHARELLGYLPKGVFKNEQEIECLGEEFKQFYFRKSCSK